MDTPDAPDASNGSGTPDALDDDATPGGADGPSAGRNRHRGLIVGVIGAAVLLVAVLAVVGTRQSETTAAEAPPGSAPDTAPPDTAPSTETTAAPTVPGETTTTLKPRRTPTGPPGPLTNSAVDLPGYERRPALVVKIDNLDSMARPQAGITLADVVYEERVEGGITRFAAVFHGADSEQIGPVRSARSTDIGITAALNTPLFGYSGANGSFEGLVGRSDLINVGAGAKGSAYYRAGGRGAPHNLFTSTGALYTTRGVGPPPRLWQFRGNDEAPGPGAQPVRSASLTFGAGIPITWTWDEGQRGWARSQSGTPHLDSDGYRVVPQNVIVQYVDYVSSGVNDSAGNPIPEANLSGTGTGILLTGGSAIRLEWARFDPGSPTVYFGPDGEEVRLAPGRTWVELVPTGQGVQLSR